MQQPIELSLEDLDQVAGAGPNHQLATGVATALVVGAATVASPLIAGTLAAGAIVAAGTGIYYALTEEQ
ncbi:MAG: hypothetical protein AAF541_09555 [Pseudomonadota bacterium]